MDARRIEVLDEAMAEVLRGKTPAERLAIGSGLWLSARTMLRGLLASLHPEWDAEGLEREVALEALAWSCMNPLGICLRIFKKEETANESN